MEKEELVPAKSVQTPMTIFRVPYIFDPHESTTLANRTEKAIDDASTHVRGKTSRRCGPSGSTKSNALP